LTDQITTMFNANTKMSGAIRRAYSIIPEDPRDHMNDSREGVGESSFGDRSMAAIQMKRDRIAKDVDKGMSMDAIVGKYANKRTDNTDDIRKIVRDYKFKKRMKNEAAIPTSEFDHDLKKFLNKVQELEDQNQHGEVAAMVTQMYGTDPENMVIRGINGMHAKQGSITRTQQQLRDEISTKYYKKLEAEVEGMKEGVISDLFKASTAEKRAKEQTASAYDAMRLEKETKKFEKQGLSPEDARKYAYRKVYGAPK